MSARDELAREIFIADNSNAKDPAAEWLDAPASVKDYAFAIANGLIAAGYVKAEPSWAETLVNDGTYEYTISSDCDGSNVQHWRRTPGLAYQGAAAPWQTYEAEAQA